MVESITVLDGYRLIRPIGRGGFGEVWLCQMESTGEYRALKHLPASNADHLARELAALIRYRTETARLQCPYLLPIEHVNHTANGLFYTMPLADGLAVTDPIAPAWQPKTLAALIQERKNTPTWFSATEIQAIMVPVVTAAQALSDAGVVHRDIKPENILFIEGRPCLGDVSLLTDDADVITRRGTPGYAAPSWYLETGGNPDMWGLSSTLYSLITGNPPDKLGRASFLWPPQGAQAMEQKAWNCFHQIIFRGTNERPVERFRDLEAFAETLSDLTKRKPLMIAGIRPVAVVRDCFIIWGLTFVGGIVTQVIGAPLNPHDDLRLVVMGSWIFYPVGYTIVGSFAHQSRWRHLFVVTFVLWLGNLTVCFLGVTFFSWLLSFPILLIWMAIGGGISGFFVKPVRFPKSARKREYRGRAETSIL